MRTNAVYETVATGLSDCYSRSVDAINIPDLQIGDPAPMVTLYDFNGKPVMLA